MSGTARCWRWATTRCCGAPNWCHWNWLICWRKSTARRRCSCARARPTREGRGATLYLARDTVQLVKTWLDRGGVDGGRVFRSVRKDRTVGEQLDASQVPRIYKRMARHAGPSRRHRGRAGRTQHARRAGAGYDRLRHRVAGHPAVRALADDAHGPPLRGAVAGAAQRCRPAGRAAAALRRPRCRGRRAVPADAGGTARAWTCAQVPGRRSGCSADVIASKKSTFLL